MILAAAGHGAESRLYLDWMAKSELTDGHFHTCYDFWTGAAASFVEPQLDPMGAFLTAVAYHAAVVDSAILSDSAVMGRLGQVESYFLDNIGAYQLAPPDYSIWEESSDPMEGFPLPTGYFAFSQGLAVVGLRAASRARARVGDANTAAKDAARADAIATAINDHMWVDDADGGHFVRQLWSDSLAADTRLDSASTVLVWGGVASEGRADPHMAAVADKLTRDTHGIARYEGDEYFHNGMWSPAGNHPPEADAEMPPWPVVTAYTAFAEDDDTAQLRAFWVANRAAFGGMPVGEAVDSFEDEFIFSSAPDVYEAALICLSMLSHQGLAPLPGKEGL
eukprot:gnl/Ergobibamus_cyprinoides/593.p1 GENE.gnl/Ergobibamus_cyprinoides/593~~gnl/Ergobibamus_cyprinoides/593.p1  ORF type:complete len:356 (+),score=128.06 gnl/Ergobibamus_cyprinoides/593:61-1068(+)